MNPLITTILGGVNIDGILGRFFPSKEKAQEFKATMEQELVRQEGEITKAAIAAQVAQTEINKVEASSASIFIAGWRPFIGWVCGMACAWNWIGLPALKAGLVIAGYTLDLRPADLTEMLPVLMGMLGLGGLRTIEKLNGQARA